MSASIKNIASYSVSLGLVLAAIWSLATRPAMAYLDPGTGSYLFQIGLASLFGLLFAIKTFWLQIKTTIFKLFGKSPAGTEAHQPQTGDKKHG